VAKDDVNKDQAKAQEANADPGRNPAIGQDYVRENEPPRIHMADQGYTVTSHGDGSPTIDAHLIELRKEAAERNASPDRANKELAAKLKGEKK
jgi:hypothetical protein